MGQNNDKDDEKELLQCLHIAAQRRASALGIGTTDYLIGILEGIFPTITADELLMARQSRSEHASPPKVN